MPDVNDDGWGSLHQPYGKASVAKPVASEKAIAIGFCNSKHWYFGRNPLTCRNLGKGFYNRRIGVYAPTGVFPWKQPCAGTSKSQKKPIFPCAHSWEPRA